MALYNNGKRISGIRDFPAYTWAEYHALPVAQRPKVWKCTDRDYTEIPLNYETITGTTDSSGVLVTSYTANDMTIVSAISGGNIVTPFVNASFAWRLKVTDTSGNPKANTSVTVYAYYVKA